MNKLGKKRLLNVAKALRESLRPKKFNMSGYVNVCGAPMCALGHYAFRRDLQKTFRLSKYGFSDNAGQEHLSWKDYGLLKHFDITQKETDLLFEADGCGDAKTNIQAAKFIEKFVKAA